jgi:hypothetical protein
MNANVLIGVTVIFVLLIAGCGLWMNATSKSVENTMDFATRVICYDSGFGDGAREDRPTPPYDDKRCLELYSDGYADGTAGNYDPPED